MLFGWFSFMETSLEDQYGNPNASKITLNNIVIWLICLGLDANRETQIDELEIINIDGQTSASYPYNKNIAEENPFGQISDAKYDLN